MVDASDFCEQAKSAKYDGIPYSKLDCQAFVEKVLYDSGVKKASGTPYNWRGSNSMWRNALSWRGTIAECVTKFGAIPDGAWLFIWANDGGEKERGYNDNEGNAKHVGIYVGGDRARDSTTIKGKRDGVGYRAASDFNRVGLCKYLDYDGEVAGDEKTEILRLLKELTERIERL